MNLLDHTKELIITLNPDGKIFFANKTAQIIFGYSENEWHEKPLSSLISKKNYYDVVSRIMGSGHNAMLDDVALTKNDGSDFYGAVRIFRMSEKTGEMAIFITDLTYRYQFRREISQKIKTIEALSKSNNVRQGIMDDALNEILAKSLEAVAVSRVNVWLSDENISRIECFGSYSVRNEQPAINEVKGNILTEETLPLYFKMLQTEEVIITDDVLNDPQTSELVDQYLAPNNITSMLDIPLRSNGRMIGVICFEHTGPMRKWTVFEIKFGVLIAQMVSLLLEGYEKTRLLRKQARLIREKDELFEETNNRAKYIFGLMNTVLAVDEKKCRDDFHKDLFVEVKNNLLNISGVHDILLNAKNYSEVNMEKKILRIFGYMHNLYPTMEHVELEVKVNNVNLHISQALTLSLVINQLIQISYEQSFKEDPYGKIILTLHISGNNCVLSYRDNGKELSEDKINGNLLELRLAEIFAEDVQGKFDITTGKGNKFTLNFPVKQTKAVQEIAVN